MEKKISVLMGIYNCAGTLSEAIESILAQTYTDWELILCDDGSKDGTYAVAESYRQQFPEKIILLKNEKNMGLNHTLNRCLAKASGEFVARMDGDDISVPERFEKEIQVLGTDPQIAVVGSWTILFDQNGPWGEGRTKPCPKKADMVYGTQFVHPSCLMRKSAVQEVGGYSEAPEYLRVEDYDLWVKLYAAGYYGVNMEEHLLYYRDDRNAFGRRKFRYRINEARVLCKAVRLLKLPVWNYLRGLRPILVGLMPMWLYEKLHKKRLGSLTK